MTSKIKRGLLLIDRGGREPEIKEELEQLCKMLKKESQYHYVGYELLGSNSSIHRRRYI